MRYIIQNMLKENHRPSVGRSVYLIMDKSGKYVFTRIMTYGTYWVELETYGDKNEYQRYSDITFTSQEKAEEFLNMVIYCYQKPRDFCSYKLGSEEQRNSFNPEDWEVVEYIQGLMPKDDTEIFNELNESEDDFGWVDELSDEPFHKILIQNDERNFGLRFSDVDRILFNPPVEIGSRYFNDVVYWLEGRDYYPNTLKELNGETSYIEITKRKHSKGVRNGRFRVGPVLSDQELYNLSQENTRPNWNGNIWYEQFMKEFKVRS